eukprot:TRINITY_DN9219_c0_g1_i1.p1 TRINITY_DN9219_c0_g1~~TRINITY_DN9219_c0_g1_i1.p1  ORF type:complete len:617 (-),score=143.17 TRINITY_DN9219_c0_g1_i1:79-1929(-)
MIYNSEYVRTTKAQGSLLLYKLGLATGAERTIPTMIRENSEGKLRWVRVILGVVFWIACLAIVAGALAGVALYIPWNVDPNQDLKDLRSRYHVVNITADLGTLSAESREAVEYAVGAAQIFHDTFLRYQVFSGGYHLANSVEERAEAEYTDEQAEDKEKYELQWELYQLYCGPWNRINDSVSFMPSVKFSKPPGAAFYPNMTRAEFLSWLPQLSAERRSDAVSPRYVIRRLPDDNILVGVAYNIAYFPHMTNAANLTLLAAAKSEESLQEYLSLVAAAFLSNDFSDSDRALIALDGDIEVLLGSYITREDHLFGYKASFQSAVGLRNAAESERMQALTSTLPQLAANLPSIRARANPLPALNIVVSVADAIYMGGQFVAGVMTNTYNYPLDPQFMHEVGSRLVLMRNIVEKRYEKIMLPVATVTMDAALKAQISLDVLKQILVFREFAHNLSPQVLTTGTQLMVRNVLNDTYWTIRDATLDVVGLWAQLFLAENGSTLVPATQKASIAATYIANLVRQVRLGLDDSRANAQYIQLQALLADGTLGISNAKFTLNNSNGQLLASAAKLSKTLLDIESIGDQVAATALIASLQATKDRVAPVLAKAALLPVEIAPEWE